MRSYERRCHLLLRAYPRRFRQARGEELVSTLLDLAAPGQTGPGARDSLDVIAGGLALRLRERPPLWHWVGYRLFHTRLPYAHRWWARDDLTGRFYPARQVTAWLILTSPVWTFIGIGGHGILSGDLVLASALTLLVAFLGRRSNRRFLLLRHAFHPDGSPLRPPPA